MDSLQTRTDANGEFEISGAADGDYTVRVLADARHNRGRRIGSEHLTVNGADVSDVFVTVGKPPIIVGGIQFDSAPPTEQPWPGLQVVVIPLEPGQMDGLPAADIAKDWSFRTESSTGVSVIRLFGLPASWTLSGVRFAGRSIIDSGLDMRLNQEVISVEVELSRNVTTVLGSVIDTDKHPATDCQVIAFPRNSEHWAFGSRYLGTTRCRADGSFVLKKLPPGDYLAAAVDKVEPGAHADRNLLEWLIARSTPFTVANSEEASVRLVLVHVP